MNPIGRTTVPIRPLVLRGLSCGRCLLFIVGIFLLVIDMPGCASRETIENARSRGAAAGRNDGQRAGEAAGFQAGLKVGEKTAYGDTLSRLYSSDNYRREPWHEVAVFAIALLLGYATLYVVLYLIRIAGVSADIDWIVLPPQAVENLRNLSQGGDHIPIIQEPNKLLPPGQIHGQGSE